VVLRQNRNKKADGTAEAISQSDRLGVGEPGKSVTNIAAMTRVGNQKKKDIVKIKQIKMVYVGSEKTAAGVNAKGES